MAEEDRPWRDLWDKSGGIILMIGAAAFVAAAAFLMRLLIGPPGLS